MHCADCRSAVLPVAMLPTCIFPPFPHFGGFLWPLPWTQSHGPSCDNKDAERPSSRCRCSRQGKKQQLKGSCCHPSRKLTGCYADALITCGTDSATASICDHCGTCSRARCLARPVGMYCRWDKPPALHADRWLATAGLADRFQVWSCGWLCTAAHVLRRALSSLPACLCRGCPPAGAL